MHSNVSIESEMVIFPQRDLVVKLGWNNSNSSSSTQTKMNEQNTTKRPNMHSVSFVTRRRRKKRQMKEKRQHII